MVAQEHLYVLVGVDEPDQGGSPPRRRGDVEEGEYPYLNDNQPEEHYINKLYHFLDCIYTQYSQQLIINSHQQYTLFQRILFSLQFNGFFEFVIIGSYQQMSIIGFVNKLTILYIQALEFFFDKFQANIFRTQLFIYFLFKDPINKNLKLLNKNNMQELTAEQYEQVLKYMEATSQQNFQTATLILKQHNFNLNVAINARFNAQDNNLPAAGHRANRINRQEQNDDEVVRKYIQFLQKQNQSEGFFKGIYNFVKNLTVGCAKLLSEILLPEVLLRKLWRSKFYVLYKDDIKVNVNDEKFVSSLNLTKQKSHKSCFLVISPEQKNECIVNLLNSNEIVKRIRDNYYFVGVVVGDSQVSMIENQRPPQVIICRYDAYKELKILKRYIGQTEIPQITSQQLKRVSEQSRNLCRRDKNVLIKYRNFIRRQYYGQMYVQEEQEQEVNFIAREEVSHHIRQQNQEYMKLEEQEMKRFNQMRMQEEGMSKQKESLAEKEELRKIRQMSIPDQPVEGEIIRFSFRCPDGSNINRSFSADEKVEILYYWVQTNQQIQLEDNQKRQFQILYSFPPTSLQESKEKLLKQVFDSDQEKLLIKEL